MTEKLLLQNTVTCLCPDKRRKYGCIICGDDAEFLLLNDKSYFHTDTLEKIEKAFESGKSAVLVTGGVGTGKTHILRRFAYEIRKKHSAVIFACFNKAGYLLREAEDDANDSYFVKDCLIRIFSRVLDYADKLSLSYFCTQSAEQLLLSLSDREAFIIIDGVDTEAVPEYVYTLADRGFRVLISSDTDPKYDKNRICEIRHIPNVPCVSQSAEYSSLCTLLNNNPHALFLACCFMKEFGFDEKRMTEWIKAVDNGESTFYIRLFYRLAGFSKEENELLMSLAVIMQYGKEDIRVCKKQSCIYTNRTGAVFSGSFGARISRLMRLGFVKKLSDGSIYMDKSIIRFVLDELKPDAENCPHLIRCISRFSDRELSDNTAAACKNKKDKSQSEQEKLSFSGSLLDIYGYFSKSDKKYKKRIYNLVMSYVASRNGQLHDGEAFGSLFLYNKSYVAFLFQQVVSGNYRRYIYANYSVNYGKTPNYTPRICALLDITEVCISFVRFSQADGTKDCKYIYRLLEDTLNKIPCVLKTGSFSVGYRLQVLTRVMDICCDSFMNFQAFSPEGVCMQSSGINLLNDADTLGLYRSFGKLSLEFLNTFKSMPNINASFRRGNIYNLAKQFLTQLSLFYNRLTRGFDEFFDFYSIEQVNPNIDKSFASLSDEMLDELLDKARFCVEHGYDCNSEKHSGEYAGTIVSVLEKSQNPLLLSCLITDGKFSVSEHCISSLVKLDFIGALSSNPYMKKKLFSKLYVHCAFQLAENIRLISFYAYALDRISGLCPIDGACLDEACEYICLAFISEVCLCLERQYKSRRHTTYNKEKLKDIAKCRTFDLVMSLAEVCYSDLTACRCIAHAVIDLYFGKPKCHDSNTLKEAFLSIVYGNFFSDTVLSQEGLKVLIGMLCDKNDAQQLYCEIAEYDFSKAIKIQIHERTINVKT